MVVLFLEIFQNPMQITSKRLDAIQKRQRILCDRRATELKQIPTPELLPMADKALEDIS